MRAESAVLSNPVTGVSNSMAGGADLIFQGNRSLQTARRGVTLCRGSLLCGRSVRWRHYGAVICGQSVSHSGSNGGPLWPVRGYNIELKNFKAPCSTGPKVSNLPKLCCIELLTVVPPPYGPATGGGLQRPISLEYQICPSHHTI